MKLLIFFSLVLFALVPAIFAQEAAPQPLDADDVPAAVQELPDQEQDDQELEDLLTSLEDENAQDGE